MENEGREEAWGQKESRYIMYKFPMMYAIIIYVYYQ